MGESQGNVFARVAAMPIDSDIAAELPMGLILKARCDIIGERNKRRLATPVNTNTLRNRISCDLLLTSSINTSNLTYYLCHFHLDPIS